MTKSASVAATSGKPASKPARPVPAKAATGPTPKKTASAKAGAAVVEAKPFVAAKAPKTAKALKSPKAATKAKPAAEKDKPRKSKLVRDSFSMPEAEYQVLGDVKKACLKAGLEVKKSELLRVGVALIRQMDVAKLKQVLDTLPPLKAGRPKKEK